MTDSWLQFLAAAGGRVDNAVVRDFGDPRGEIAEAAHGNVLADLSHFGVLSITGDDARAFLQAQLSCDVLDLPDNRATFGCYCTAKGRVLANFLLWREPDGFRMLLRRSIAASIEKRLRMHVLRAKVVLADRSADTVALGLSGPAAFGAAASIVDGVRQAALHVARQNEVTAIAYQGPRMLIVAPVDQAPRVWPLLAQTLKPVGTDCWAWLDIVNGLPWIGPATQDEFVPQMANLELIGAVNFRKGCYPGQEVVARMQYLGTPKRRLALAHVESGQAPAEGDALMADESDQSAGMVVNAAPAPVGGFDVLVVAQTANAASGAVRLATANGPRLEFRPLPYAVP